MVNLNYIYKIETNFFIKLSICVKKCCLSKQILFILFLNDETYTHFIISLFNEFHMDLIYINLIYY